MSELTERAKFNIIRYANCWEDADVMLKALDLKPGSSVLSIASAGDNSFSLLSTNPEIVMAADISEVQLHLLELKKAAMQSMDYENFLAFIGVTPSNRRLQDFELLKNNLSSGARNYWNTNTTCIEAGLIHGGKFERYFSFFRKYLLPLVHNKPTREELFVVKSSSEQAGFYIREWNNFRWRMLFKLFFSKAIMGKFGRDPEFLKQVKVPVNEYIFKKAEHHLMKVNAQENYLLNMIILGDFGKRLPHYLREENYGLIKANLSSLKTYKGYAQDALKVMPPAQACNCSNIFEYMPDSLFKATVNTIAENTPKGCKMAYWNLMVPRRLSGIAPEKYIFEEQLSKTLTNEDCGFFYNGFYLDIHS